MKAATDSDRSAAAVGYALAAAAVAIMLGYFPSLSSPFVAPKLTVLVVAGACGFLGWAARSWGPRPVAGQRGDDGASARPSGRPMVRAIDRTGDRMINRLILGACAALGLAVVLSAALAVRRGPPGAPYAAIEIIRLGATFGVAVGAAFAARAGARHARRLCEAIHASAGLVALIGLAQHLHLSPLPIPAISVPGSTFGNRNVAAEAVAMAIPFGLGLLGFAETTGPAPSRSRHRLLALFLVLEIGYLAVARARGAWLGGALGMGIFFALRRPRLSRATAGVLAAAAMLAVVGAAIPGRWTAHDARDVKRYEPATRVVRDAVDPSSPVARTRLALWRRTWALYLSHPLAGIGVGNFPVLFPLYAEPNATRDGVLSPTAVPRRAHNDLLEQLAETGPFGLGALLALHAALGVAAVRRVRAARREGHPGDGDRAAACAGSLAAFVGCGLTGFPFAMPATVYLFGVAVGLLAAETATANAPVALPVRRAGRLVLRPMAISLGVALAVFAAGWSARRLQASYFVARFDAAVRAGDTPAAQRALQLLARADRATPRDFAVALRASAAELQAGHPSQAGAAAGRALDVEPYSANAWEALARARLAAGDPQGAAAAADRALGILHDYPGALATRAEAAGRLGDAATADGARARLSALAVTDDDARRLLTMLGASGP
jgi:O-antigen ligase